MESRLSFPVSFGAGIFSDRAGLLSGLGWPLIFALDADCFLSLACPGSFFRTESAFNRRFFWLMVEVSILSGIVFFITPAIVITFFFVTGNFLIAESACDWSSFWFIADGSILTGMVF